VREQLPTGDTDLHRILREMSPIIVAGEYVMVSLPSRSDVETMAVVVEGEGITHVMTRATADQHGWPYEFVGGWITLQVHSSLTAVGLTAAVSSALAEEGISCNMLAGFFHDHLLVPHHELERALSILRQLATGQP
jgi:hypothetical protein